MKLYMLLIVFLLLSPALARAGAIYGTVRTGGSVMGISVMVACPSFSNPVETAGPVPIDARGSFTLHVQTNGRCQMRAQTTRSTGTPFTVFSSSNSLRYDFQVDPQMNRIP